ncbi:uncharacterized protein P7C73_g2148, partial [Tremellales sp. Uapishka_1]
MASTSALKNVLSNAKSPYLLQHKNNPVAWQEFTPETIKLAQELQKPIFLSSGYSACHWCHVLAHESFEDEETAKIMNESFVNIKVDREERPDVDRMYMTYLQATQGGGGWPLSVFMTPNLEPFFAGTYFPPGRFRNLLDRISDLWEEDQAKCEEMGKGVIESLKGMNSTSTRTPSSLAHILSQSPSSNVYQHLQKTYDPRYGGFSSSGPRSTGPKFPSCSLTTEILARIAIDDATARDMGIRMLRGIWEGGIRDWVGGGVARYSVDEQWKVPHFEKMLYDQAQLISAALDFALLSDSESDRKMCLDLANDMLEYTFRDLLSPEGCFWSAEDADSAAVAGGKKTEGAFYVWTQEEIEKLLGENSPLFQEFFGIKMAGNVDPRHDVHGELTGKNILHQRRSFTETGVRFAKSAEDVQRVVREGCEILKQHRDSSRERPGLDDKVLVSWNGLMLTALAKASFVLPSELYPIATRCIPVAEKVVEFIRAEMWETTTRTLTRSYRQGKGPASGNEDHLLFAIELQQRQDELFWDEENGGYFASAPDEHVLVRMKDSQDGAEPSATSVSVHNNSKLSLLASNDYDMYEKRAEDTYLSIAAELEQIPRAFALTVCGLMDLEKGYREFVVMGPPEDPSTRAILKSLREVYIPNKVVIQIDPANPPVKLAEKNETVKSLMDVKESSPSLRVCEGGVCGLPIYELEKIRAAVRDGALSLDVSSPAMFSKHKSKATETASRNQGEIKPEVQIDHVENAALHTKTAALPTVLPIDSETSKYLDPDLVISEEKNAQIKRQLDKRILPFLIGTYFFQTFDKGTLSFASVMGIQQDTNLHGQQYALLGTILYIGILVGELPMNRLIQRVRLGKFLGILVTVWGAIVLCHAACKTWSQLMAVRFFLGLMESGVQPCLMTMTTMYYRRSEHPTIISYWYCQQGVQLIVGGIIAWALTHVTSGPIYSWQGLFLVVGGLTVIWGICIIIFMPDSPMKAKCWTDQEKTFIIERLRVNELGVQERKFKWEQMWETFKDPVVWVYLLLQFDSFLIVNGLSTFSNIIVKGLGFSVPQTQLLNLAQGGVSILIFIGTACSAERRRETDEHAGSAWLARLTNQTCLVLVAFMTIAMAGTIALDSVAVTSKTAAGLLIAFYFANFVIASGNLLWSLVTRNIAGQSKKVTTLTLMFVAYAVGAIIGPQIFQSKDSPRYHTAFAVHIALYAVYIAATIVLRFLLMRRNAKRRAEVDGTTAEVLRHENAFADLTDRQNTTSFRYAY